MNPIFPASYFGSIAYFKEIAKYNKVFIEGKEHFPKQTYRNRCDILSSNGIISLSIPTKRSKGSKTETEAVLLSDQENWRIRHWRSITSSYQSAAYFDYYKSEVKELLFSSNKNLLKFNINITKRIIKWLDLKIELKINNEFTSIFENDLRTTLTAKNSFQEIKKAPYIQVFPSDSNFKESLSILDAIFCEGPMSRNLLLK